MELSREVAQKVLDVVDQGLVDGVGVPEPGKMCVEAAVCYALGLPHGDDPACVSRALRSLKIRLNDSAWSSDTARAKGLRRLAVAQLGSRDTFDDVEFARRVVDYTIRTTVPAALRAGAFLHKDHNHRKALYDAADRCEAEGSKEASDAASDAASYAASYAARAASDAASDAARVASYAARDAARAASDAASDAARAARAASDAARYAARAASDAARYAASYAASAASDAARYAASDDALNTFAEAIVQILIDMKAPGCAYLDLTQEGTVTNG